MLEPVNAAGLVSEPPQAERMESTKAMARKAKSISPAVILVVTHLFPSLTVSR